MRGLRGPAITAAMQENAAALSGLTEAERAQFVALRGKIIATRKPCG